MRLLQKIGLLDMTNRTRLKKEIAGKSVQKVFAITLFNVTYAHLITPYTQMSTSLGCVNRDLFGIHFQKLPGMFTYLEVSNRLKI